MDLKMSDLPPQFENIAMRPRVGFFAFWHQIYNFSNEIKGYLVFYNFE